MSSRDVARPPQPAGVPPGAKPENDGGASGESPGLLYGVESPGISGVGRALVMLPNPAPANDEFVDECDNLLDRDPEFAAVCNERRARWIEAMESDARVTDAMRAVDLGEGDDDECT